jgi:hypothetical protein
MIGRSKVVKELALCLVGLMRALTAMILHLLYTLSYPTTFTILAISTSSYILYRLYRLHQTLKTCTPHHFILIN